MGIQSRNWPFTACCSCPCNKCGGGAVRWVELEQTAGRPRTDKHKEHPMYTPTQRLMRSRTEKVIAGVAGGIGQYLAIDPVIVRLAFAALCLTGVGVLLYPILWLVMPLEGSPTPAPEQALH